MTNEEFAKYLSGISGIKETVLDNFKYKDDLLKISEKELNKYQEIYNNLKLSQESLIEELKPNLKEEIERKINKKIDWEEIDCERLESDVTEQHYDLYYTEKELFNILKTIKLNSSDIEDIKINKIIASVTIIYNPTIFKPKLWEDLIKNENLDEITQIINNLSKEAI